MRSAVTAASEYVQSDDGKKLIDKASAITRKTFNENIDDVLSGKTPRLIETAKGLLQFTDPANRGNVITDIKVFENRLADERYRRERSATEQANVDAMNDFLALEDAEQQHESRQDLFQNQQLRYDSEVSNAVALLSNSTPDPQQKKSANAIRKALIAIRNHLRFEEDVSKKLATASSVKAGVDTFGDFIEAIPVIGAIVKGITDVGSTAATITEAAITFNGPDFTTLNNAIVEMNEEVKRQIIDIGSIHRPLTINDQTLVFRNAMTKVKSDIFRINRPHMNTDFPTERETYVQSLAQINEGQVGLHVYVPAISDTSLMILHYQPGIKDDYHVFLLFDVAVQDLFRVLVRRKDENGMVKSSGQVRQDIWLNYARARDDVVNSELKFSDSRQKDSSNLSGTYGNGLAHVTYLGTGKSGDAALIRSSDLIRNKEELMHHRTSQEFRSIIASVMMGNLKIRQG